MKLLYTTTLFLSSPVLTNAIQQVIRPDGGTCTCPASCSAGLDQKVLQNPPSIKVERHVLTEAQCEAMLEGTAEEEFTETRSGYRFFTHLQENDVWTNICGNDSMDIADTDLTNIPISRVATTSADHQDRYADPTNLDTFGTLVDEDVVLLYLNDNPNAYFVYQGEKIPLSCGTKLTFHGGYPHHTEVTSGPAIKFLGPLTASSCSAVGDYSYNGFCESSSLTINGVCSCPGCTIPETDGGCCARSIGSSSFGPQYSDQCVVASQFDNDPTVCPSVTPTSGDADGDPHFKTFGGAWFDFHGICDLVFVENPDFAHGLGLHINIRTKGRYEYSYIESAAIQIGSDTLEVSSWGEFFYNGVEGSDMVSLGPYPIHHDTEDKKHTRFTIPLGNGEEIVLRTFKDLVGVHIVNATEANFAASRGLMGSFPTGTWLARDGTTVLDEATLFGEEWQVTPQEPQLFQSPSQHAGQRCVAPKATGRRLGETISIEAADMACARYEGGEKDRCIFDVIAMGDLEVADAHGAF